MIQTAKIISIHSAARGLFDKQHKASRKKPPISRAERHELLFKLESILIDNQEAIAAAISQDFGNRSVHETKILEIFPAVTGLRYTRRHLKQWMKPQHRHVAFHFKGANNRVIPQPKGVVGIIAPWNYPLFSGNEPIDQCAGRRQPLHDQDGGQFAAALSPPKQFNPQNNIQ